MPCSTSDPNRAFLTLPTSCLGPQTTTMSMDSWPDPGNFLTASFVSHDNATPPNPIGVSGCSPLAFAPPSPPTDHPRGRQPHRPRLSLPLPQGASPTRAPSPS